MYTSGTTRQTVKQYSATEEVLQQLGKAKRAHRWPMWLTEIIPFLEEEECLYSDGTFYWRKVSTKRGYAYYKWPYTEIKNVQPCKTLLYVCKYSLEEI